MRKHAVAGATTIAAERARRDDREQGMENAASFKPEYSGVDQKKEC